MVVALVFLFVLAVVVGWATASSPDKANVVAGLSSGAGVVLFLVTSPLLGLGVDEIVSKSCAGKPGLIVDKASPYGACRDDVLTNLMYASFAGLVAVGVGMVTYQVASASRDS